MGEKGGRFGWRVYVFGVPEVGHEGRAAELLAVWTVADETFQGRRGESVGDGAAKAGARHVVVKKVKMCQWE